MAASPHRRRRRAVNGILLLDKPLGLSSNTALQRAKRLFQAVKAGHTGSLDPLATGVLPICFGEATKLSSYLLDADKTYVGRARLGVSTTTGDAEGTPLRHSDASAVNGAMLEAAIGALLGPQRQIPPMYSALKHSGVPLYTLAREGLEVERAPRDIVVHALRLLAFENDEFEFELRCSKGTYVRTLAEDWAGRLGQAAHLVALRRTALGALQIADTVDFARLDAQADNPAALDAYLLPPLAAVADWPRYVASDDDLRWLSQGRVLAAGSGPAAGACAVVDAQGRLRGLADVGADGRIAPRRWLLDAQA